MRVHLEQEDTEVICVDKLSYASDERNLPDYVKFYRTDLSDAEAIQYVFEQENIEQVFHLAAESHVDNSIINCKPFVQSNVLGTVNLLQCALENDVDRFMHISTDEVFGSISSGSFSETSQYNPRNPYSASKAASDHFVMAYYNTYGLPTIITNCSNNYGPRQHSEKMIPKTILSIMDGKPVDVYGSGTQVRDWIYVDDHCKALIELWEVGRLGQRYNIGGECELENIELVHMIAKLMKEEPNINFVEDRLGHDQRYSTSNDKITTETPWTVSTHIEEGLLKTIKYYYEQN